MTKIQEENEDYETLLILRAFKSARIMWETEHLLKNPGLLLLEIESLRNLDLFNSSCAKPFKSYKEMTSENKN